MFSNVFNKLKKNLHKITGKKIQLFSKSKFFLSFNPFILIQGMAVFIITLCLLITFSTIIFPPPKIDQAQFIKLSATTVKQLTPAVSGQTTKINWTVVIKRSQITAGQHLLQLPKTAKNIKIRTITEKQAKDILATTIPDPKTQLTLEDRKTLASVSFQNLFAKLINFLFANIEQALSNSVQPAKAIEQFTQPEAEQPQIIQTQDAIVVDLSDQAEPAPTETSAPAETSIPIEPTPETDQTQAPTSTEIPVPAEVTTEVGSLLETPMLETVSPSNQPVVEQNVIAVSETAITEDEYVQVDYQTPAPMITEQDTDTGKLVTVSDSNLLATETQAPLTNVLAYAAIPEIYKVGQESKIKLKWKNNDDQEMPFTAFDLNNNGKIDYIEWTVPHLSDQIFEIIFISKAFELDENKEITADIYDTVKEKDNIWATVSQSHYVRVTFQQILDSTKDITIYARPTDLNQQAAIEVYAKDSDQLIAAFENINQENTYKVLLTNLPAATDVFDLKIIGDIDIDYIVDPSTFYWVGAEGANISVASNWKTTDPAGCGAGDALAAPGATDTAVFDADCDSGAAIDSNWSVAGLTIQSGYTGTITQGTSTLNVSSDFSIASGATFTKATGGQALTLDGTGNLTDSNSTKQDLGNVTIGGTSTTRTLAAAVKTTNLTINSGNTLIAAGYAMNIGGSWSNSGTFTHNNNTVTFDATSTGKTITSGGSHFYNLFFDGAGGGWTIKDVLFVDNNLTVNTGTFSTSQEGYSITITGDLAVAGTLSGGSSITVSGGDVSGNGTISLTDDTFLLDGTGSFGGNTDWSFYNLTFGDGTGEATTAKQGNNNITALHNLTIAVNQTLQAGSNNWNLSWAAETNLLTDISQIVAGSYHTLALKSDGSRVYTWGRNNYGQLGDNTIIHRNTPVQVLGLNGTGYLGDGTNGGPISQIAAGGYHSLALKSDGSRVYSWGFGGSGQLGNNTATSGYYSSVPVQVLGLSATGYLGDGTNGGPISKIAGGGSHSLALKSDGTVVYAWGYNLNGQLGNNSIIQSNVPVQVLGLLGVGFLGDGTNGGPISKIAAGSAHSLALKSDGSRVYSWGLNSSGQLGDNTTTQRNVPVQVLGLSATGFLGDGTNGGPISQIAAGAGGIHSLALKSDGARVYAWGKNAYGQLGDNSITQRNVPVRVLGLSGTGFLGDGTNGGPISNIIAGIYHSLALKSDGAIVYSWGRNDYGQLGDNTITTPRKVPVQVLGLSATGFLGDGTNGGPISAIAAGDYHSTALKSDDSQAYAWGLNTYGQLGDNSITQRNVPVQVLAVRTSDTITTTALTDISQIITNGYQSLALKSDGTRVYAWGYNGDGELGDNTIVQRNTPVQVLGLNATGFLGDGTNGGPISAIAAGDFHSLALKSDGTRVYTWGGNTYGQLGDNTTTQRNVPVQVLGLNAAGFLGDGTNGGPISAITAGDYHSTALKSDGTRVYTWGRNNNSQLGDNTTTQRNIPVQVLGLNAAGFLGDGTNGGPISQINGTSYHTLALKSDGTRVYAWGLNTSGQLGNNNITNSGIPVQVLGLNGTGFLGDGTNGGPISKVDGAGYHSLALKSDGTRVYAWGNNTSGQLGDNTTTQRNVPVEVLGLNATGFLGDGTNGGPISQINGGGYHSLALKSDGTRVYAWGNNSTSRLGDNTTTQRNVPVEVLGLNAAGFLGDGTNGGPISQINASGYHSLALKSDGAGVYGFGLNNFGQLGNNTTTSPSVPVQVIIPVFSSLVNNGTLNVQTSIFNYIMNYNYGNNNLAFPAVANIPYYDLTLNNSSETFILPASLTISRNFSLTSGTLDVTNNNYGITVSGNWSNSGTFTPRSGTVTFNGASQTISGSTTFYNLTKAVTSADTLTFPASATQTINSGGTLTLQGASGQLLNLRSSSSPTKWGLTLNGSASISYVDVKDSDASGGTAIIPTNHTDFTDSGNNLNWLFNTAPSFSSGPSDGNSSSSAPTNIGSNVTFTATAADSESNNYYLAICKTNSITANTNAAPTCGGGNWCISGSSASGSETSCTYTILAQDSGSNAWYGFVCDYTYPSYCSSSSQGTGDSGSPFNISSGGGGGLPAAAYMPPSAPAGGFSVQINNGALSTDTQDVVLSLRASPEVLRMSVSNDPNFTNAIQEPYQSTKKWRLTDNYGQKNVYVKFFSTWGKATETIIAVINYQPPGIIDQIINIIKPSKPQPTLPEEQLPALQPPLSLTNKWDILPIQPLKGFVNLTEILGGIPLAQLTSQAKEKIPTGIIFVRGGGGLIDYNINLFINAQGGPQEKITTIVNQPLQLIVRSDKPAKAIKGYLIFKQKTTASSSVLLPFAAASLLGIVGAQEESLKQALILSEFDYQELNREGIWTAEINSPEVEGNYEIITIVDYQEQKLKPKELNLVIIVDPDGYIYHKTSDGETRIANAQVSLYWFNPKTEKYELWPAKNYQQDNPQTTDKTGHYSFLVPEGRYYLKVEASGYLAYQGELFEAKNGSGIHAALELQKKYWWFRYFDWIDWIIKLLFK